MAYLDEAGLQYFVQKLPTKFVKKVQTVNGKELTGNIVLKAADFAQSVTGEKDLASLVYTEPRTDVISITGKTIAAENVTMPNGVNLDEVLHKGQTTSNPTDSEVMALVDGTYKVSVDNTNRFPVRYGTLFISTAGATYKMYLLVGTTGGLWYRLLNYPNSTWYDDWKQAQVAGANISSDTIVMPYNKTLSDVLGKGSFTSNPSSEAALIGTGDGTYKVSVDNTNRFPIRYGTLFISTAGATYKMFVLVGTNGGLWYRIADYNNETWYDDWRKAASTAELPSVSSASYTPTFTWTGTSTGPTVTVNSCTAISYGKMIQISCRFSITELNAPSSATTLSISLPQGVSAQTSGGILGELYHAGATNDTNFLIQCNTATALRVVTGTGLGSVSDRLTAQSYGFSVVIFNTN